MHHRTPFRFVLQTLKPFKKWVFIMLFCCGCGGVDRIAYSYLVKVIIDRLQQTSPHDVWSALFAPITIFFALGIFITIIFRLLDYAWMYLNPGVKRYAGEILMQRMMQHSHQLYQQHFAGGIASRVKEIKSGIPDLVKHLSENVFWHMIMLPTAIFVIAQVHAFLGWALAIWLTVFLFLSYKLAMGAKVYGGACAKANNESMGAIVDILSNIMSVRLFAAASTEKTYLKRFLDKLYQADITRDWYVLKMFILLSSSFLIYEIVSFTWLIYAFQEKKVTVGDFALVFSLSIALIEQLWNISKNIGTIFDLIGNITQSLKLILSPIDITDKANAAPLKVTQGIINFNKVQFEYVQHEPLFQNKTITIEGGSKVGLVGYSGSGKTTFVHLILRLYDISKGEILIDGQNIQTVTQDSLRQAIALIPQDPYLFHRTLKENIAYGKKDARDTEIITAAKKAHAHAFIENLPQKYKSLVGERGVKLSGGQRQRIAIARAFLKQAPILILDEATSQLDSITENKIQESLKDLMTGKTTIVIAHRLSTLLQMDRILVFDKGQIVQDGSHQTLVKQNGLYHDLWNAQVGGFLPDQPYHRFP